MRKNLGFGLLELVLVLAVVGVILAGVFQLYHRTNKNMTVFQATAQIKRLLEVSHDWLSSKRESTFSTQTADFMPTLVAGHWLQIQDATNPWGGAITLHGLSSGDLIIGFNKVPQNACKLLQRRFTSMESVADVSCKGGNLELEFLVG